MQCLRESEREIDDSREDVEDSSGEDIEIEKTSKNIIDNVKFSMLESDGEKNRKKMSPCSQTRMYRSECEGRIVCNSNVNDANNVKNVNYMLNNNRNEISNEENGT